VVAQHGRPSRGGELVLVAGAAAHDGVRARSRTGESEPESQSELLQLVAAAAAHSSFRVNAHACMHMLHARFFFLLATNFSNVLLRKEKEKKERGMASRLLAPSTQMNAR
jgi:hypothetical protein